MRNLQKDSVLNRLRHHHYMMINCGGTIITLCILLAATLEIWALIRDYQTKIQQDLSAEVSHLTDARTRTIATLRNGIQNIETFISAPYQDDPVVLHEFRKNNGKALIQPSPLDQPVLVLATNLDAITGDAWPALALAVNISPMAAKIRDRNAGELSAYIYSNDGNYLISTVAPWTPVIQSKLLEQQYDKIVEKLSQGIEAIMLSTTEGLRPPKPVLHWFPVSTSSLTQKSVFRIATTLWLSDKQRFGTLVFELPEKEITGLLPAISHDSECLILDETGNPVLPCSSRSEQNLLPLIHQVTNEKRLQNRWVDYQGDRILRGWKLNSGDWTFVYAQSWKDILDDNRQALVVILLSSFMIIFITWFLLMMVKIRVLLPAVRQSEQVFESEQLSRTLIDTAPVGLGLLGLNNGKLFLRSPLMAQMQTRLQIRGYNLPAELIRTYQRQSRPPLTFSDKGVSNEDLTFGDQDDFTISLSVSVTPVRYRGEDTLVVAFIDVTDKKQLEKYLLSAKEAADRASAAKTSFLATMSHEIRTPLNAILGNLELLEYSALDSQRSRLAVISHASNNLLATISDVLDFSKIEAGELHVENIEFDIVDIATQSLEMFSPVAQAKGITLTGELGNTVSLPIVGDPTCMQQVLNNLLSNALKFTERGEVLLSIKIDESDGQLHIEIQDSGIGMTAGQLAKIFNPFSQADETINRRYGGTGLGLALCMRLVNTMGGEISVTSEPGKGSLFRITFTLNFFLERAERPNFDGKTVTLICAYPQSRNYLIQALRSWGLEVEGYQHPAQIDCSSMSGLNTLIIWGDKSTWHPDDENRLVEEASQIIDCNVGGPQSPLKTGRLFSTSVYGLKGLALALGHVMQGTELQDNISSEELRFRELRVLVAEDNYVNARLFEEQLHLLGCVTKLVHEGEQALLHLQAEKFDILLTDLSMPGMDGYTLARRVKDSWPDMPIMAITANATQQEYQACEAVGISRVLIKPLLLAELNDALFEVVVNGHGFSTPFNHHENIPLPIPLRSTPNTGLLGGEVLPDDVKAIFKISCNESLANLKSARRNNDAEVILNELHSLHGAFGVFEMHSVIGRVNEAENLVKTGGIEVASDVLDMICQVLEDIVKGISVGAVTSNRKSEAIELLDQLAIITSSIAEPGHRIQITLLEQKIRSIIT